MTKILETTKNTPTRLDKWLWAARFFKTRALARAAVEGGKVEIQGVRAKPAKLLQLGMRIIVRIGYDRREFVVAKLMDKRGSASVAQTLYTETHKSIQRTTTALAQRKTASQVIQHDQEKPGKHQRKRMQQFKRQQ